MKRDAHEQDGTLTSGMMSESYASSTALSRSCVRRLPCARSPGSAAAGHPSHPGVRSRSLRPLTSKLPRSIRTNDRFDGILTGGGAAGGSAGTCPARPPSFTTSSAASDSARHRRVKPGCGRNEWPPEENPGATLIVPGNERELLRERHFPGICLELDEPVEDFALADHAEPLASNAFDHGRIRLQRDGK